MPPLAAARQLMRTGMAKSPCVTTPHRLPFRTRLLAAAVKRERELPPTGAWAARAPHTQLPQGAPWWELHEPVPVVRRSRPWRLTLLRGLRVQSLGDARKIQPTGCLHPLRMGSAGTWCTRHSRPL
jgi:hypothetical protein